VLEIAFKIFLHYRIKELNKPILYDNQDPTLILKVINLTNKLKTYPLGKLLKGFLLDRTEVDTNDLISFLTWASLGKNIL